MGRNDDPCEQVATLAGIVALAGAGVGGGSALVFAERRAGAQDRELEALAHRVTMLERLSERVTRLERGSRSRAPARRRDLTRLYDPERAAPPDPPQPIFLTSDA